MSNASRIESNRWRWPARRCRRVGTCDLRRTMARRRVRRARPAVQLAAVGLAKSYRKGQVEIPVLRGVDLASPPRRVPVDHRPKRLRQEHAAAPAGHARRARRRRDSFPRPADRQPAHAGARSASQPAVRHDLSVLSLAAGTDRPGKRAGPADDCRGSDRLLPPPQATPGAGHGAAGVGRAVPSTEAQAARAVGRRNAAHRHRAGLDRQSDGAVGRRADRQSRCGRPARKSCESCERSTTSSSSRS